MGYAKKVVLWIISLVVMVLSTHASAGWLDIFQPSSYGRAHADEVLTKRSTVPFLYDQFSEYYCIEAFGQELCGYDCMPGDTHSGCAPHREANCVTNDYGVVTCGYGCVVSGHDMQCGTEYHQGCARDQMGRIVCGENCHCGNGALHCDKPHYDHTHHPHHSDRHHYGHHEDHHYRHDHGHPAATINDFHHYDEYDVGPHQYKYGPVYDEFGDDIDSPEYK